MPRYAVTLHLLERYVGKEVIVVVTKPEGRKHKAGVVYTTKSLFLIIDDIETDFFCKKLLLYIYVMTRLLKDGLCINVIFMHNGCWVNYYEK